MIEEGLTTRLTEDAGMEALIQGRVYCVMAPQGGAAPYVVFSKLSGIERTSYCASDGVEMTLYQFDSYDKTLKGVKLVAKALRQALVDFHGLMGDTHVKSIKLENETDLIDPDPGLYRVLTTLVIWHKVT
jgi:hypothetical protein